MIKPTSRLAAALAVTLALVSLPGCSTNSQGDDAVPLYISVDFTLLPAIKHVSDGSLLQFQTVTLKSVMKSPTAGTSSMLDVRLDDYVITWSRLDGGTKTPQQEIFAGNVLIPVGGTSTLSNYPFMSISALSASPFDQLFPYNGGIDRETGKSEIRCAGTVIFRGHTISGMAVQSVPATFNMTFIY
jgi:hypothetical protein